MIWTVDRLERLIAGAVPESAALEYKQVLSIGSRPDKLETLKDLTGMANGGGGTVIYGMAENEGEWPIASVLMGLSDRALPGRLEDIVRSGVQPPLLAGYQAVELSDGTFALVVELDRSPLGPNMVEAYGTRAYHRRVGTRTFPMTETEVRDGYQLALRVEDRRRVLWERHGFPLAPPTGDPWLLVSAVPSDPLREVIDLEHVTATDFLPPDEPTAYLNRWELADLTPAQESLTMWADGYFSDDIGNDSHLSRLVRIHRDGSLAFGIQLDLPGSTSPITLLRVSRILNGLLRYMGWIWDRFGLRDTVEVHLRIRRTDVVTFDVDDDGTGSLMLRPDGSEADAIERTVFLKAPGLLRASSRHLVVRDFADRFAQAFGRRRAEYPFRLGELYGQTGEALGMSVGTDAIYADQGGHIAWIYDGGAVCASHTGKVVGRCDDDVLTGTTVTCSACSRWRPASSVRTTSSVRPSARTPVGLPPASVKAPASTLRYPSSFRTPCLCGPGPKPSRPFEAGSGSSRRPIPSERRLRGEGAASR